MKVQLAADKVPSARHLEELDILFASLQGRTFAGEP